MGKREIYLRCEGRKPDSQKDFWADVSLHVGAAIHRLAADKDSESALSALRSLQNIVETEGARLGIC